MLLLLFLVNELLSLFDFDSLVFQDSWEVLKPRPRLGSGHVAGLKYVSLDREGLWARLELFRGSSGRCCSCCNFSRLVVYTLERLKSDRRPAYRSRAKSISLVPTVRSNGCSSQSLLLLSAMEGKSELSPLCLGGSFLVIEDRRGGGGGSTYLLVVELLVPPVILSILLEDSGTTVETGEGELTIRWGERSVCSVGLRGLGNKTERSIFGGRIFRLDSFGGS